MYLSIYLKVKKKMKKEKTLYPQKNQLEFKELMTPEFITFLLIAIIFMLSIIFAIGETSYYNMIL